MTEQQIQLDPRLQQTTFAVQQEARLVKVLARLDIVYFIVAAVISMDTIGTIASGGLNSLTWGAILVVTFMAPYAMLVAETAAAFTQEGGPYQWTKFAFGRFVAGVTSVFYWITNPIWLGGSLAFIAFAAFQSYVVHVASGGFWDWAFKIVFVWAAILLAVISLKTGKFIVNLGAFAKIAVLVLLVGTTVIYGIMHGFATQQWGNLAPSSAGFLSAISIILFAYVGFEAPSAASQEMYDPANDTGPAIRQGSAITMAAYLLPVFAIILVLPVKSASGLGGYMDAMAVVFHGVWGPLASFALGVSALLFVFAIVNQGSSWMMATDRIQAIAAADGTFFGRYFGVFSERFGTPVRVNITSGIMATAFVIAAMEIVHGSAASVFAVVLNVSISTLLLSYLAIVPALMVLRKRFPSVARPYRVPGGTVGFMIMGTVITGYIILGSLNVLFPSLLPKAFSIPYDFGQTWGLSATRFEGFTLGTCAVVFAIAVLGFIFSAKVRGDLAPGLEIDEIAAETLP